MLCFVRGTRSARLEPESPHLRKFPPPISCERTCKEKYRSTPSEKIMVDNNLEHLNKEQRAAVRHRSRPLLIVAGAGTGKTETLSSRVAHLIVNGASADRILLLTFTRKAAQQMARRAAHAAGRVLQ